MKYKRKYRWKVKPTLNRKRPCPGDTTSLAVGWGMPVARARGWGVTWSAGRNGLLANFQQVRSHAPKYALSSSKIISHPHNAHLKPPWQWGRLWQWYRKDTPWDYKWTMIKQSKNALYLVGENCNPAYPISLKRNSE